MFETKSKSWSLLLTVFVAFGLIGLVVAVSVPSLMRARVSTSSSQLFYEAAGPQTSVVLHGELALDAHDREAYAHIRDNPFRRVVDAPLSTFAIDVDSASYSNVRRFLEHGRLPPKDAVRIEEMLNYFRFEYPDPPDDRPFGVSTEVAPCPWQPDHHLVAIGLQGRRLPRGHLPALNLVFLLDVSGSMNQPLKLPLVKAAMRLLVANLTERDRVAIVVYAGASGLVLPPTPGRDKGAIRAAIDRLGAGGSTAGAAGIRLAYRVARDGFVAGGVNRVILATDGDFNVGVTSNGELVRLIEEEREHGVELSVLGFGTGNVQDSKMEQLADHGDGNYAYVDSLHEARRVLVTEAGSTLVTIAKDVKVQVELNPERASAYRLIGYENRILAAEDFDDDHRDAGEIGAGHSVTALYEVVPIGVGPHASAVDPLRYQNPRTVSAAAAGDELMTVKLRYKEPGGGTSRLLTVPVRGVAAEASTRLRFAAAVAGFGMLLRDSEHKGRASYPMVVELVQAARGADPDGSRTELLQLVRLAESLDPSAAPESSRSVGRTEPHSGP